MIKITMVPLDQIKTDPTMALNFLLRRVKPGVLSDVLADKIKADGTVSVADFLTAAVQGVTKKKSEEEGANLTPAMIAELKGNRKDKSPTAEHLKGYKAPFHGVRTATIRFGAAYCRDWAPGRRQVRHS